MQTTTSSCWRRCDVAICSFGSKRFVQNDYRSVRRLSRAQFSSHRTVWLLFSQNARAGHLRSTKETTVAKSKEKQFDAALLLSSSNYERQYSYHDERSNRIIVVRRKGRNSRRTSQDDGTRKATSRSFII